MKVHYIQRVLLRNIHAIGNDTTPAVNVFDGMCLLHGKNMELHHTLHSSQLFQAVWILVRTRRHQTDYSSDEDDDIPLSRHCQWNSNSTDNFHAPTMATYYDSTTSTPTELLHNNLLTHVIWWYIRDTPRLDKTGFCFVYSGRHHSEEQHQESVFNHHIILKWHANWPPLWHLMWFWLKQFEYHSLL